MPKAFMVWITKKDKLFLLKNFLKKSLWIEGYSNRKWLRTKLTVKGKIIGLLMNMMRQEE